MYGRGHNDCLNYTLRKAITFFTISISREKREAIAGMESQRAAYHADEKSYKKIVESHR